MSCKKWLGLSWRLNNSLISTTVSPLDEDCGNLFTKPKTKRIPFSWVLGIIITSNYWRYHSSCLVSEQGIVRPAWPCPVSVVLILWPISLPKENPLSWMMRGLIWGLSELFQVGDVYNYVDSAPRWPITTRNKWRSCQGFWNLLPEFFPLMPLQKPRRHRLNIKIRTSFFLLFWCGTVKISRVPVLEFSHINKMPTQTAHTDGSRTCVFPGPARLKVIKISSFGSNPHRV